MYLMYLVCRKKLDNAPVCRENKEMKTAFIKSNDRAHTITLNIQGGTMLVSSKNN